MKLFKKITAATLAFMIVLGIASSVQARVANAHLQTTDYYVFTEDVHGTHKYFSGSNSSSSKYHVYFTVRYREGDLWKEDFQVLLPNGEKVPETRTTHRFAYETDWHVKLNPKGTLKRDCEAWAFIWNA